MADNKKAPTKVPVRLPKLTKPGANQEEFFSVNFKNVIIRRGETVYVDPDIAEAIRNSELAKDEAIDYAESKALREPKEF